MEKHIMLDLETLGHNYNAPIIQIGVCVFNRDVVISTFYRTIDFEDLQNYNFTVDYSTIKWWMEQSNEARASVIYGKHKLLETLLDLEQFLHSVSADMLEIPIWSHATFDPIILKNAYRVCNIPFPIHYKQFKDLRTLDLLFHQKEIMREGTHHDALDDAIHQANYVQNWLKTL